jgi:hypothetical protein
MVNEKEQELEAINSVIKDAIQYGVRAIGKDFPVFGGRNINYIANHIDQEKIRKKAQVILSSLKEKNWNDERKVEYLHHELADYVSTGEALDSKGQRVILKKGLGLEERAKSGFFGGLFGRRTTLDGEKYLGQTLETFHDLYILFKSGGYSEEKMPEIAEALSTMDELGFKGPAYDILRDSGHMTKKEYNDVKKLIAHKANESVEKFKYGMSKGLAPVLGIIGLALLLASGFNLTGGVIGVNAGKNVFFGLIGAISFLVSLYILLVKKR